MTRLSVVATTAVAALLFGSCLLFVVKSDFYVANETDGLLTVIWTEQYDPDGLGQRTETVPVGETVRIATGRLLEADTLPPELFFATLQVTGASGSYTQAPIDDDEWEVVTDGRLGRWTLTVTAADLQ